MQHSRMIDRRERAGAFVIGGLEFRLAGFTTAEHAQYVSGCLRQVRWRALLARADRQGRPLSWGEMIRALERAGVLLPLLAGIYTPSTRSGRPAPWTSARAVRTCRLLRRSDLLGDDRLELARLCLSGFCHFSNNERRIRELARAPLPDVVFLFPLPALR